MAAARALAGPAPDLPAPGHGADLALDLYAEGTWPACRVEARRALLAAPTNEAARLLAAVAGLRCGVDAVPELAALCESNGVTTATRAMAAYELGRDLWGRGLAASALPYLRHAFLEAPDRALFLRAGCTTQLLLEQTPALDVDAAFATQLASCRRLWTRPLREECALPPRDARRGSWPARPAQWAIAFYRTQIRPALGARCSLEPSCSEYARQALARHGLLGLAFFADRTVREPDVVAARATVVEVEGRRRYADPVEDHDFWMRRKGSR